MMKLRLLFSVFSMLMMISLNAQITSVGIIGSATPGAWDSDTDMTQDPNNPDLWTIHMDLIAGEAKFRADDAWTINWGDTDFPVGIGTQDGPNIPIVAATYDITFNSATGAYSFVPVSDIGIIGSATPGGWDFDTNMFQDETDTNEYTLTLELIAGEAKFRAFDDWAVNWGAADFPSGIGTQDGPNIPIPNTGTYRVSFNKSTGAYNFEQLFAITSVGIVGDGTPGGATETPMYQDPNNANIWTLSGPLTNGGLEFSVNNGQFLYGSSDFPTGIATNGGGIIPVTEGNWQIEYNAATGEYTFNIIEIFATVGIIGSATPGGWDADTDMERDAADSSLWSLRIELVDGEAKFRANDDWVVNWGAGDFPSGIATRDGANIPVPAGEYIVTFNSITGEYNFRLLIVYDRVGIVGTATPNASWDIDIFMTKNPDNEDLWTLNSVDLSDGDMKFRADSNWTVNWGDTAFPHGFGTQDGPNITVPAGTYGITLNSATGEYLFSDPLATKDILDPSSILAYPNPASDALQLDLTAIELRGKVSLNVFDINGRLVLTTSRPAADHMTLNVAGLQDGYYTLQISSDKYIIGKKFMIVR